VRRERGGKQPMRDRGQAPRAVTARPICANAATMRDRREGLQGEGERPVWSTALICGEANTAAVCVITGIGQSDRVGESIPPRVFRLVRVRR